MGIWGLMGRVLRPSELGLGGLGMGLSVFLLFFRLGTEGVYGETESNWFDAPWSVNMYMLRLDVVASSNISFLSSRKGYTLALGSN